MNDYDKILEKLIQSLEQIQKENSHITPTINDFYDLFLKLKLKNIRTEENTELIVKALKSFMNQKITKKELINDMIKHIILPNITPKN